MMNLDEESAKELLARIQGKLSNEFLKHAERLELWDQLHALAEFQYKPAIELFVDGLNDPNSAWRLANVSDLGFHYPAEDLRPYIGKLHGLLLEDPDEDVRRAAASVIGRISNWPDTALLRAVERDQDATVREMSFEALLLQLGVSLPELRILRYELRQQGKDVSREALNEIAHQKGMKLV